MLVFSLSSRGSLVLGRRRLIPALFSEDAVPILSILLSSSPPRISRLVGNAVSNCQGEERPCVRMNAHQTQAVQGEYWRSAYSAPIRRESLTSRTRMTYSFEWRDDPSSELKHRSCDLLPLVTRHLRARIDLMEDDGREAGGY